VNTWHANPTDLAAYAAGEGDPLLAASVETHLLRCADCRAVLAGTLATPGTPGTPRTPGPETERRWADLTAVVDRPAASPLARLGISSRPLRTAWLAAALLVLALPLVPAFVTRGGAGLPTLMLALAPIAPTIAVVVAYRRDSDPVGEMALAAPVAGLRIVSGRALLVAIVAAPVGVAAALLLGLPLQVALGWLLPGLALSTLVLLAGTTRIDPALVAGALGAAWAVAVAAPSATRQASADAVTATVSGPSVQLLALGVAAVALVLTVSRRESVAYRRSA
jgi:hypothetical protein